MNAYTVADAYVFVDIPKSVFSARRPDPAVVSGAQPDQQAVYAAWGDPGYTDQIILGAPRSYEVAASFKW